VAAVSGALALIIAFVTGCAFLSPPSGVGPVDTPDEALAAVLRIRPDLADAAPLWGRPKDGGPFVEPPRIGGREATVRATPTPDGIELTFTIGIGDCPSGCTDVSVEVFLIAPDGTVIDRCRPPTASSSPAAAPPASSATPIPRTTDRVLSRSTCEAPGDGAPPSNA
jgi:hypothetical protein